MFVRSDRQLGWARKFEHISPATGKGRPMLDMLACGVPFSQRFEGALNEIPAREIENGHEFEIDAKTKLRTIWTPSLGTEAAPMHRIEGGVLKEELQLDAHPNKNNWIWNLDFPKGTRFVYQGPLDPDDLIDYPDRPGPSWRPDWVVGSYAVFDATGFKIAHIYRPLAIDRDGKWVWGEMQMTPVGVLRVTIPREFLDDAAYPVIIDPTVGFTSKGGTADTNWAEIYFMAADVKTPATNGSLTSVSFYVLNTEVGAVSATLGAYDVVYTGQTYPYNRIGDSAGANVAGSYDGWVTQNLDAAADILTRLGAYLAITHDTGSFTYYYDADNSYHSSYAPTVYSAGSLPQPAATQTAWANRKHSAYGTYTAAGGGGAGITKLVGHGGGLVG